MSTATKGLLAGGGALGLGSLAAAIRSRRQSRRRQSGGKQASVKDLAEATIERAVMKKAGELVRTEAAGLVCRFLDSTCRRLPLEKTAAVRNLQQHVSRGRPLAEAIKLAYPQLTGEQRGIFAYDLVRNAVSWRNKQADMGGGMGDPAAAMGGGMGASGMAGGGMGGGGMGMGMGTSAGMPTTSSMSTTVPMAQSGQAMQSMGMPGMPGMPGG